MRRVFSAFVFSTAVLSLSACTYLNSMFSKDNSALENEQPSLNQGYAKFEKENMNKSVKSFQKYYAQGDTVENDNYRFTVPTNFAAIDDVEMNILLAHSLDGMVSVSVQKYLAKRGAEVGCDSMVNAYKDDPLITFLKKPYFVKTSTGSGCELFVIHTAKDGSRYVSYEFTEQFDSNHMYEVSATINYPASYENYIMFIKEFFKNTYSPEVQLIIKHISKDYDKGEKIIKKKDYNVGLN